MKIIDISWNLNEKTTKWKDMDDLKIEFKSYRNFDEHNCRSTMINIQNHQGFLFY
jgi:kynurenine formamidase